MVDIEGAYDQLEDTIDSDLGYMGSKAELAVCQEIDKSLSLEIWIWNSSFLSSPQLCLEFFAPYGLFSVLEVVDF